ncbi:MAG: hypothetical protein ABWX67_07800 [Allosphingosinicella sp.]
MRILGLIAATSALLAACGERRDDSPPAAPANASEAPANESGAPADESVAAASQSGAPANQSDGPAAGAQVAEAGAGAKNAPPAAPAAPSPCIVQDGKPVIVAALRAVGTEPFWGALIQGRCVTYSTPDDQKGARLWTRFAPAPGGGTWSGTLGGKRFELRIRTEAGCSDGMSDRRYPLAAELLVGGERRTGCAAPA